MNRIFKVIWNRSRGQYVVADENCTSNGKGRTILSLAVSALLSLPGITGAGISGVGGTTVNTTGNVHHVTTSHVSGKVGFNRFSDFTLPAKQIANLYHPAGASHLVNFVGGKNNIVIDGTVNSIIGSKIGGNLYFVTPNGFTVGSTGVINAGSVTAAVVKSADFYKWYDQIDGDLDKSDWVVNNGALLTAFRKGEVPVNPNGVITVNGSINAGNGITLTAARIKIGNGVRLKTGVNDFSNLVNIQDGETVIDSEIKEFSLSEIRDGTGDIVLKARGDAIGTAPDKKADATIIISGDAVVRAKSLEGSEKKANAIIESNALAGELSMEYSGEDGKYVLKASRDKSDVMNTVTALTVIGSGTSVYADGVTSVSATADNTMDSTYVQDLAGDILNFAWQQTPLGAVATTAAWAKLKTSADVVIEDGASVSGDDGVGISANSRTALSAEGMAAFTRIVSYDQSGKVPSIGVGIGIADSNAKVKVGGDIKSAGDIVIDAQNELTSSVSAAIMSPLTTANPTVLALSILNGSATVDVDSMATIDMTAGNGKGNLIIGAEQISESSTSTIAMSNEGAHFALAFSWADINTDATVNLGTGVTGKANNVSVFSDNTSAGLKVMSETGWVMPWKLEDIVTIIEGQVATGVVAAIMGKSMADLKPDVPAFDNTFKGGVAGTVVRYGQHATTNVAENAVLTATGDLEVTSSSSLEDHYFKAEGGYKVKSEGDTNAGALALLVTTGKGGGITSETAVGNGAVLSAGGRMNVTSATAVPYGRVSKMIEEVESSWEQLKTLFTPSQQASLEEKKNIALEKLEEYGRKTAGDPSISPVAGGDENVAEVLNAVGDYYETMSSFLGDAAESFRGLIGLWMTTREFANFTNYTNTYVGAGGTIEAGKQSAWSAEGAFAWNELSSKSLTTIGRGAKLSSGSGMSVSASEQITNTLLAGFFERYTSALGFDVFRNFFREGDASPIGATLGLQFLDGQASVKVMEGAVLESTEGDVSLSAKTDTVSVGIAGAASKTNGKTAATVMANAIIADVVSEVSVDDEARLISDRKDVSLTAENDASLQSVSASVAWQSGKESTGAGMAGVSIVLGDMTADVTVADNDGGTSLYDVDGLLSAGGTLRAKTIADTKSNAIGAAMAGTAAKSEGAKELKPDWIRWLENHNLPDKIESLLGEGIGKFVDSFSAARGMAGVAVGANSAEQMAQNPIGDGNSAQIGESVDFQEADFQLDAAGSAAWNTLDVYSTVNIGAVRKDKDDEQLTSKKINISTGNADLTAFSDHWIGAWAGSGAISLMGDRQNIKSGYSVAGTLAMNKGDLVTKTNLVNADLALSNAGSLTMQALSDGKLVSEGLALAVTKISGSAHSFDADVSLNIIDNRVSSFADTVNLTGGTHRWHQTAWAGDVQVTGGTAVGVAIGQSSYAVGAAFALAMLDNSVLAETKNATLGNLSAFSLEALSSMTQVTTSVSGQIAIAEGTGGSTLGISGAAGVTMADNNVTANAENVTATLAGYGAFDIVSESVTRNEAEDKGIETGSRQSFYSEEETKTDKEKKEATNETAEKSTDNRGFIKNVELKKDTSLAAATDYSVKAGKNQKVADLMKAGKLVQVSVVADAAVGGNAVGAAVLVEDVDNSFTATGKNLSLNEPAENKGTALRLKAESKAATVGVAAGAAVSGSGGKIVNAGGSVIVSNVDQSSVAGLSGSTARVSDVSVEATNDAVTVNVAGQAGVTLSSGAAATIGAAVVVANTENTANAYVKGTSGNASKDIGATDSARAGRLTVTAGNHAQSWAAAIEAAVSSKTAIAGSVAVNRVFQHTDATLSGTALNNFSGVTIGADDGSSLWTLAGGVSVSWNSTVALNGAVAYTQAGRKNDEQEKDRLFRKTGTHATVSDVVLNGWILNDMAVSAATGDELHTLAVSSGVSNGVLGFAGSANVNSLYHATGVDISGFKNGQDGQGMISGAFKTAATNDSSIDALSITAAGSVSTAAVGLATAVNRMGTDTTVSVADSNISSGSSSVRARSDLVTNMIGLTGQGSGTAGGDGFVAVNLIDDRTSLSVADTAISTWGGNVLEAIGTSTIGSYAGSASGAGVAAGNISVSVSERTGDVTAQITDSSLTSTGSGNTVGRMTGIDDGDIVHEAFKQDIAIQDSLAKKFRTEDTTGVSVDVYSASTFKTFTVLGAGAGTFAGNGLGIGAVDAGHTDLGISGSKLASAGSADTHAKAGSYTNFYSVLAEGEGAGVVSLGVNGEWITSSRDVNAAVSSSTLKGRDVTLDAENKTGISGVSVFAGAAGTVSAGVAAVIARNTGSAHSSLTSSTVTASHDYLQDTYRLSRFSFLTTGAHGAGAVAATGDAFVSYDSGLSLSNIAGSSVTAGNDILVNADRSTEVTSLLTQVQGAPYAAIGGIVAVNTFNTVSETIVGADSRSRRSVLSAGHDVGMTATGRTGTELVAVDVTGSAHLGSGAIGVGVTQTSDNATSSVILANANVTAGNNVDVVASQDRFHDQNTVFVTGSAGKISGALNVSVTGLDINTAYDASNDPNAGTKVDGYRGFLSTTGAGFVNEQALSAPGDVSGSALSEAEKRDIVSATSADASKRAAGNTSVDVQSATVHGRNVSVKTAEDTAAGAGADLMAVDATAAISMGAVLDVNIAQIDHKRNMSVGIIGANVTADNSLTVSGESAGSYRLRQWSVGVGMVNLAFEKGEQNISGLSSIAVSNGSKLTGKQVTMSNTDKSVHSADARSVEVGWLAVTPVLASVTDKSRQAMLVSGSTLNATDAWLSVERNHVLDSYVQPIVAAGIGGTGSHAKSVDDAGSGDWMTLADSVFNTENFFAEANDCADVKAASNFYHATGADLTFSYATAQAIGNVGVTSVRNTFDSGAVAVKALAGHGDEESPETSKSLRLSAELGSYGAGILISGGLNKATTESSVTVKNTFKNNRFVSGTRNTGADLTLVSGADARLTAKGKSAYGSVLPVAGYIATAKNDTNTVLDMDGLVSGEASNVGHVQAGTANKSTYDVESDTFEVALLALTDPAKSVLIDRTSAETNISGHWSSSEQMLFFSSVKSDASLYARSDGGAAIGTSGAVIDATTDHTSALNVTNASLTAGSIDLSSVNDITLRSPDDGPALKSTYYGALIDDSGRLTNRVGSRASVTVRDSVLTAGNSVAVGVNDKLVSRLDVSSMSGSAVAFAEADTVQSFDISNDITLAGSSLVKTTTAGSKIALAAWSEEDVTAKTEATAEGVFVGAIADTDVNLSRNNRVTVGTGTTVFSSGNVDIRAGRGYSGEGESVYRLSSETVTKGIPVEKPVSLTGNVALSGTVTVEKDALVRSVADTDIYTGEGKVTMLQQSQYIYDIENEHQEKVTANKKNDQKIPVSTDAVITVDGSVIAGFNSGSKITIKGLVDEDAGKHYTITDSNGNILPVLTDPVVDMQGTEPLLFTTHSESVANIYWERHMELRNLISAYQGLDDQESRTMVLAYMQEDEFLIREMIDRGLAVKQTDGSYYVTDLVRRGVARIGGITVSGGDISLTAKEVKGTSAGELRAQGGEGIHISNESNMSLEVADLTILKDGGHLTVNNADYRSDEALVTMQGYKGVKEGYGGSAEKNSIVIDSDYTGDRSLTVSAEGKTHTTIVDNAVTVTGKLVNRAHDISITSHDTITIGETASLSAAGAIRVSAQGSVVQRYSPGLMNVGGDVNAPESIYKISVDLFLERARQQSRRDGYTWSHDPEWLPEFDYAAGIVAGGDIYIAGQMINVNGIIQSGFTEYTADLANWEAEKRLWEIYKAWSASGSPALTSVKTDTFLVKKGGPKLVTRENGDQSVEHFFVYEPDVWYDPSQLRLVVDDVVATGGHIYITGQISSTGAGRIYAADGPLGLTAKAGMHDLVLGKVDTGADRVGLVKITDTAYMNSERDAKVTEYTGGKTTSYYTKATPEGITEKEKTVTEGYTPYQPMAGLIYGWTDGEKVGQRTIRTADQDFTVWGLFDWGSPDINWNIYTETIKQDDLVKGATVAVVNRPEGFEDNKFVGWLNKSNVSTKTTVQTQWTTYDNWTHFSGTHHALEETIYASTNLYSMTVKADKEVTVGMLKGTNSVEATAGSFVFLGDTVTAKDGSVTLSGQGIFQTGDDVSIKDAKTITLRSSGSIGNASQPIRVTGQHTLSDTPAWSETAASAADLAAMSAISRAEYDALAQSKVLSLNLSSNTAFGTTNIDATGWINRIDLGTVRGGKNVTVLGAGDVKADSVSGENITVSSSMGSVYLGNVDQKNTAKESYRLNGSAKYRYTVADATGDLSLGQITTASRYSEVSLSAKGSIKNGLPRESEEGFTADQKIATWKEMGLLGANGENIGEQIWTEHKDLLEKTVASEYGLYQQFEAVEDKSKWSETTKQTFAALESRYKGVSSVQEALDNNTEYRNLLQAQGDYGWTQTQLLYAVADSVINPDPSSSTALFLTLPNVTASKVTLNANTGSVGTKEPTVTGNYGDFGDEKKSAALYKALAMADIADISWDKENRKVSVTVVRPVTIASPFDGVSSRLTAEATGAPESNVTAAYLSENPLVIDKAAASDELRISSRSGMTSADGAGPVTGDKVTLRGGEGGIDNVAVNAGDWVALSGKGDISVSSPDKPLILYSVAGGSDVVLTADEVDSYTDPEDPGGPESKGIVNTQGTVTVNAANIGRKDNGTGALRVADGTDLVIGQNPVESLYVATGGTLKIGSADPDETLVIRKNDLIAGTGVMKLDAVNIETTSGIETESSLILATKGGYMTTGGPLKSDEDIFLEAATVLTVGGDITAKGDVNLKAGDIDLARDDAVTLAGQNVTVESDMQLDLGKANVTATDGNVHLHADEMTAGDGEIRADKGTVTLIARDGGEETEGELGGILLEGTTVTAKDAVAVTAKNLETSGASIGSAQVNLSVTENILFKDSAVQSVEDLEINSKDVTAENSQVTSDGNITADVSGSVVLSGGKFTAGGNISVKAGEDVTSDAGITAGKNVSVEAGNKLTLTGDTVAQDGDVSLKAADIDLNKTEEMAMTGKNVTVESDTQLDLGMANVTATDGNVHLHADAITAGAGEIRADKGTVTLIARDGGEGTQGELGDILLEGTTVASGDALNMTGKSIETSDADIGSQTINLNAGETIALTGSTVNAGQELNIQAGDFSAENSQLTSEGDITADVSGSVALTGGEFAAGGDISMKAGKDVTSDAGISADRNITVEAVNKLTLTGDTVAEDGDVMLKAADIDLNKTEEMAMTGKNVTVESDTQLDTGMANITATDGNVHLHADAITADAGEIRADKGTVTLLARDGGEGTQGELGDILLEGTTVASGDAVNMTGKGIEATGADIKSQTINLNAGETMALTDSAVNTGRELNIQAGEFSAKDSQITSEGDITANVSGSIALTGGEFSAAGDISVKAGEDVTSDAGITAGKDVSVEAGNKLTLTGDTVAEDGDVTLKAGDIRLLETETMALSGHNVSFESDTMLNLGSANVTATSGDVTVHTDGLTAGGGEIKADKGSVNLTVRDEEETGSRLGDVVLEGTTVTAKDGINVTGRKLETYGADIGSAQMNLNVTESILFKDSTVTSVDDLKVKTSDFTAENSQIISDGDITADVTGSVALTGGQFATGGDISVKAGEDVTSDAGITAGKDVSVEAGNKLTLTGDTVAEAGDVTLKATDVELRQTQEMTVTGQNVTIESKTYLGLGTANVTATDGDVYAHSEGLSAGAGEIRADKGSVSIISRDEESGLLGDVLLEGTTVAAKDDINVTGRKLETYGADIGSAGIDFDVTDSILFKDSDVRSVNDLRIKSAEFISENSQIVSEGDITADVTGSVALTGGQFAAGGDISVKAGEDVTSDAGITAGKDVSVVAGNKLTLTGDTVAEDGDVSLKANGIELKQTEQMTVTGNSVTVDSVLNFDMGTAKIEANDGDIRIGSQEGITSDAAVLSSPNGSIILVGNKNGGTGDVNLNGLTATASEDVSVTGNTVTVTDVSARADTVGLDANGEIGLLGATSLNAQAVRLMSQNGSVIQSDMVPGAGISADKTEVSAENGSVNLGALPVGGIGGNRMTDMTVTVRDDLNIGTASENLALDITQADGRLNDVTVYNAAGTVSLSNDLSAKKDVLVYGSGISAAGIKAGNLLELSTLGLENSSASDNDKGIKTGNLEADRVAVATSSGDIRVGDVKSANRVDIYRNSKQSVGNVSVGNVNAGSSLIVLNALGPINAGVLYFTDKKKSALVHNRMFKAYAVGSHGIRDLTVERAIGKKQLQSSMRGGGVTDASLIKGAHIDLLSVLFDDRLPRDIPVIWSHDLYTPTGYYFGLNVREDISADSVDGLPVIHEHQLTEDGIDLVTDVMTLSLTESGEVELGYR